MTIPQGYRIIDQLRNDPTINWHQQGNYQTAWLTNQPCTCPYFYGGQLHAYTHITSTLHKLFYDTITNTDGDLLAPYNYPNAICLNYYHNGDAHLNWHGDTEPLHNMGTHFQMDPNITIFTISLGDTRTFQYTQHNNNPHIPTNIELHNGDLKAMQRQTQTQGNHRIQKSYTPKGPRISATYRYIPPHRHKPNCPCFQPATAPPLNETLVEHIEANYNRGPTTQQKPPFA